MPKKIKIDDQEYDFDSLSDEKKSIVATLNFIDNRTQELVNIQALLQRAKNSYIESLKKEMLSDKAGFLFGDD